MATIRHHARIPRPAEEVWALVTDPAGIDGWLPGVDACSFDGEVRTVATMGIEVEERILTNDPVLRRFQYSIVGGAFVPEHHLATIDVIDDGGTGTATLVVYSCDVSPDEHHALFDAIYASAIAGLVACFGDPPGADGG